MGKEDKFRGLYDPVATMQNVPDLLGMELTWHGNGLQGGYYLNGDKHSYRRDKLKVFIGLCKLLPFLSLTLRVTVVMRKRFQEGT